MNFHVLTLFPEMIEQGLKESIIGRAVRNGLIQLHAVNIRDYADNEHGKVDDYPYGGGAGLLMQAEPVFAAHRAVLDAAKPVRTIYLTPQGRTFNQRMAEELVKEKDLIILCGHYEGVDERVLEEIVTDYVSLGDFVLTGGEPAALVMIDAIARLVPGVLHNEESAQDESFSGYLLEYPQYSRPEIWHGRAVPEVLLTGNHQKIRKYRLQAARERTKELRPDLYTVYRTLMEISEKLQNRRLLYRDMLETISRGNAEVLLYNETAVLLRNRRTGEGLYAAWENAELGDTAKLPCRMVCHCEWAAQDLQKIGYRLLSCCRQYVYTLKESPHVPKCDIRKNGRYEIYRESGCCGYIEQLPDGSMGNLYVEPAYRRQGLGECLERFLIQETLRRGDTPFIRIPLENTPALCLQEKLGLYAAKENIWILER